MTKINISDPSQLFPAITLYRAMQQAESDSSGQTPIPVPIVVTGDSANPVGTRTVLLVPPGQASSSLVADVTVNLTVARDLMEVPDFVSDFCAGGDRLANSSANIGDVIFVPSPSVIEADTEAEQAQKQV